MLSATVSPIIFWIITAVVVLAALGVVLSKNIVHSALYLVLTFVGIAAVYMMLEADFLAAVQLLIYAGAVSILLVFGVMLTRRGNIAESNPLNSYRGIGALVAAVLFLGIGRIILQNPWTASASASPSSTVGPIAELMLGDFVIPFEVAALLLLVAMVGAIILARGVKQG